MSTEIVFSRELWENVTAVIDTAIVWAKYAVDVSMVYAYFEIGKMIVEEEQKGKGIVAKLHKWIAEETGGENE